MKVISKPIDEITPYASNPRNNDEAVGAVANSIKEFGWQQPIVVDKDMIIIAGHTRYKAAKKLGVAEVPVVIADKLTPEQVKAYRLADNRSAELADWDNDLLDKELKDILDIDMTDFGFDDGEITFADEDSERQFDDAYSQKTDSIEYKPQGEKPDLNQLLDTSKYDEIKSSINKLSLPDDVKHFLLLSATRFIKFDFAKIAEFYAQSSKQIQEQFEKQLLVIVDYNDALKNGLANFQKKVRDAELNELGVIDDRLK